MNLTSIGKPIEQLELAGPDCRIVCHLAQGITARCTGMIELLDNKGWHSMPRAAAIA